MNRLELPAQWHQQPILRRRIADLCMAGRRRTALDELLRLLRQDPEDVELLYVTLIAMTAGRSTTLESSEPPTTRQLESALIGPIVTECSACPQWWASNHLILGGQLSVMNPLGLQCQTCRHTLCRDCLKRQMPRSHKASVDHADVMSRQCPVSECGGYVTTPVLPTGRHYLTPMDPETIEHVLITRDGPILPTIDDVLSMVMKFLPLTEDDARLITIHRTPPEFMTDRSYRQDLTLAILAGMERDGSLTDGAMQRAHHLIIGSEHDSDHVITIVRKPARADSQMRRRDVTETAVAPAAGHREPHRDYAGLTRTRLIDCVVACRRTGRTEDRELASVLAGLRRSYGHPSCPFAASLERLAFGTSGPPLFQESMEPDEVEIVTAIFHALTGGGAAGA